MKILLKMKVVRFNHTTPWIYGRRFCSATIREMSKPALQHVRAEPLSPFRSC